MLSTERELLKQINDLKVQIILLKEQAIKDAHTIQYLQGEVDKANEYVKRQSSNSMQMGD